MNNHSLSVISFHVWHKGNQDLLRNKQGKICQLTPARDSRKTSSMLTKHMSHLVSQLWHCNFMAPAVFILIDLGLIRKAPRPVTASFIRSSASPATSGSSPSTSSAASSTATSPRASTTLGDWVRGHVFCSTFPTVLPSNQLGSFGVS